MIARILATALLATIVTWAAEAAEFVYSATSGPACAKIRLKREFNSWRCQGPTGYSALFHDLGNMVAVELGPTGKENAIIEDGLMWPAATKPFGGQIEWRMNGGKPYSAILRIWRQDFDDKTSTPRVAEELLVIKVSPQGACRVGVVDSKRPNANTVARQIADSTAAAFRCGTDQPRAAASFDAQPN